MQYIESPQYHEFKANEKSVFLAGGISGCPNWQQEIVSSLSFTELTLLNPRRKYFPEKDNNVLIEQIKWEYEHLRNSYAILFWFPNETLCPIALYELGCCCMNKNHLFIGIHPGYKKRHDIEIQLKLVRPELKLVNCLPKLVEQIKNELLSIELST